MTGSLLELFGRILALSAFSLLVPLASTKGQTNQITSANLLGGVTDTTPVSPADILPPDFRGIITYEGNYSTVLLSNEKSGAPIVGGGRYTVVMSINGDRISGTGVASKPSTAGALNPGSATFTGTRNGAVCRVTSDGGFTTIAYCGRSAYRENARFTQGMNARAAVVATATQQVALTEAQTIAPPQTAQNPDVIPADFRGQITYSGLYKGKAYPLVKLLTVPGAGDYRLTMEFNGSQISGAVSTSSSITGDHFSADSDSFIGERSGTICRLKWRSGNENVAYCSKTALRLRSKEKITDKPGWFAEYTVDTQAREIVDYGERDRQQALAAAKAAADQQQIAATAKERLDRFRARAAAGDAAAMAYLGQVYEMGDGVAVDFPLAMRWFRAAADKGDTDAFVKLGLAYYLGRGVPVDRSQAVRWYRLAAERGHVIGMTRLGDAYAYGDGIAMDQVQAVRWYRAAAEKGDASGMYSLGDRYYTGEGVAFDEAQAIRWWRAAASKGDEDALKKLQELGIK